MTNKNKNIHLLVVFDFILQYDAVGFVGFVPEQRERVARDVLTLNHHDRGGSWGQSERVHIFIKGLSLLNCTFVRFSWHIWHICLSFITSQTNREGKDKPRGQGELFLLLNCGFGVKTTIVCLGFFPRSCFCWGWESQTQLRCASSSLIFQRHITQSKTQ